jgi:hypothetical protein
MKMRYPSMPVKVITAYHEVKFEPSGPIPFRHVSSPFIPYPPFPPNKLCALLCSGTNFQAPSKTYNTFSSFHPECAP